MHKKFREYINIENKRIITESYEDYKSDEGCNKEAFARQIRLTALGDVRNREGSLNEWMDKFKDEEIVLNELKKLQL